MSRNDYFDNSGYCHDHGNKNCIGCRNKMEADERRVESESYSRALMAVPVQSESGKKEIEIADIFYKQADMLKTVLELSEDELDKIKIKDMPELMKKVQEKATVGHMKKLLAPRPGLLEKLLFKKG